MNTFYARLLVAFLIANFVVLGISVVGTRVLLGAGSSVSHDFDAIAALANETYIRDGAEGIRKLASKYRPGGLEIVLFEDEKPVSAPVPRPVRDFGYRLNLDDRMTVALPMVGEYLHSLPLSGEGVPPGSAVVVLEHRLAAGNNGRNSRGPDRPVGPANGPPPGGRGDRRDGPPGGPNKRPPPDFSNDARDAGEPGFVIGPHRTSLLVYLGLLMVGIAVAGWIVARQLTAPLRSVQSTIRRFSKGDLSARVGSHLAERGDDMGELAGDFDRMAAHVEEMIRGRDRLLHHLSHEMRSPLARLRFAIELARSEDGDSDAYLRRADREVDRLDGLMNEMLQLARAVEDTLEADKQNLSLSELLHDAVQRASIDADAAGVSLELSPVPDTKFPAHAELLSRAIDNVLLNAIRYSPEGGVVKVSAKRGDTLITIEVADNGPGVPPGELKTLFEPFYRASNAAPGEGYGLGLAIVNNAMLAHGGYAEAENRKPHGLLVRLAVGHSHIE